MLTLDLTQMQIPNEQIPSVSGRCFCAVLISRRRPRRRLRRRSIAPFLAYGYELLFTVTSAFSLQRSEIGWLANEPSTFRC